MNSGESGITQSPSYSRPQVSERDKALVRLQVDAELELRRRFGTTFQNFTHHVRPSFVWYKHCDALGKALDKINSGEIKRLMVFEPPRHGKSEECSRLFPAYYLFNHPTHHFGITSYAAELAFGLSRDARDNYKATSRPLSESAEGMVEWHTHVGGRCWSAGVGGPITGKGGNCLLIDDPIKNEEEAYSLLKRDKVWEWYQHTLYTRLEPDGAMIIVLTRWHDDDLAGRVLNEEKTGEDPERWHVLNLEAIKETTPQEFPASCVVIPDWRKPGEALCPERFDAKRLNVIKGKVGDRAWRALYQQNPIAEAGNIWRVDWFGKFDDSILSNGVRMSYEGCDWDLAYGDKKEENAACAFVRSQLGSDGNIYVWDCDFRWYEFPEQTSWMKEIDAPHFIEAKGPGKSAVQSLSKAGAYAQEVKVRGGDKVARTILATPIAEQGRIYIHKAIWDKLLFDERQGILGFPARPFNDLNDAFTQMIHRLWPIADKVPIKPKGQVSTVEEMTSPQFIQENIFDRKLAQAKVKKVNSVTL